MVIETNENLKNSTIQEIENLKSDEVKFAVTLDEWTSNKNRRYMNVNIFSPYFKDQTGFKNLGLVRISGKGTAQHCLEILRKKLDSFNLSLDKDIICLTTDGASVMTALGQAAKVNQQLCPAHGVQLGIIDVLYKKSTLSETEEQFIIDIENTTEEAEESQDSDDENGAFEKVNGEEQYKYKPVEILVYNATIEKVRKVARMFRKSPTKNDILKKYVLLEEGNKELGLKLDCKTRWSSMEEMITRFLRLRDSVSKALIDLKSEIKFSDAEVRNLTELSESLAIIKASVEALCQRDANLITAVTAIKFMLKKLRQDCYTISKKLADSIEIRMVQRLTKLTGILLYLQNPTSYYRDLHTDINNAIALDNDEIRSEIISIINKKISMEDIEPESEDIETIDVSSINIKDQLRREIRNALQPTLKTADSSRLDLETRVRVEMALYDEGGHMGNNLKKVYQALKSIPPTSVESERIFSSAGLMCNKIRSSLGDDSLNALVSLRSYYQNKK